MKSAGSARASTPHWGAATPDAHSRPPLPGDAKGRYCYHSDVGAPLATRRHALTSVSREVSPAVE
jgi:hypothetical protein